MEYKKFNGIGCLAGQWPLNPDKPCLVFIHGAASSALFWESQINGLADQINTVAIDLPGHGRAPGDGEEEINAYARTTMEFIDQLKTPRPIPCGLSMGGAVVQRLLINYPAAFSAGVIVNSGARLKSAPFIFEMIEKDYQQFSDLIYKFAVYEKNCSPRLLETVLRSASDKPEIALKDFRACHHFDCVKELGDIRVPVLILAAEEDKLTPLKYSEFLENAIKRSKLVVVKEAGHFSPLEKPELVNEALREFVLS